MIGFVARQTAGNKILRFIFRGKQGLQALVNPAQPQSSGLYLGYKP
jgi:hypothetical protein